MSFYGVVFRLLGWAIGIGLITGRLTYYNDGSTDGLTVALGWGILIWWAVVTVPLLRAMAAPSRPAPDLGSGVPAHQASSELREVTCPRCETRGRAQPVAAVAGQVHALRGHDRGHPVVRCLHCDAGFQLSPALLRASLVPADRWSGMDAVWRAEFPELARNEDAVLAARSAKP